MKKKSLKQYFTDAESIKSLMCQLLGDVSDLLILEPGIGHGSLLSALRGNPERIDGVDVDPEALAITEARFPHLNLSLHHCDFIRMFDDEPASHNSCVRDTFYDAVISNPPYGLYFDPAYRRQLKKQYPGFYVRESYGLFFMLSVLRLKENGRYVFIIPDTFLTSVIHKPLRDFIAREAAPSHIIRFASKQFKEVSFGYGNLCIIAGYREPLTAEHEISRSNIFDDSQSLETASATGSVVSGGLLLSRISAGWSSSLGEDDNSETGNFVPLGDMAECRTGIYTGDNLKYIGFDTSRVTRKVNGHPIVWGDDVRTDVLSGEEQTHGIASGKKYVPMIRGGHRQPFEQPSSAINWSRAAVSFYRTDKKARLQNAGYYFRRGLTVPMVSTQRISASVMENAVFDQGAVGIFPHDPCDLPFLLIYLNSSFASRKIKEITNGSANNSANYLKRLPVPVLTADEYRQAAAIYSEAEKNQSLPREKCDDFISSLTALPVQI